MPEGRLEAFVKLLEGYGYMGNEWDHDCEEDVRPYLSGEVPLEQYICVTSHGDKLYFYSFQNLRMAQERGVEYVGDSLFDEMPFVVIDIDTGDQWVPVATWNWLYREKGQVVE